MKLGSSDISAVKIGSTDVNKIYIGSTEVWTSFTGLLDTYTGAASAYSLRLLSSTYTGDAIEVRRASDNTTQDIGFVNNELDTTSLASFCSGTNGFVTTWYDQSGNGNDATQTTASAQPQIVSSGSVILENGKPAVQFDGSDDVLSVSLSSVLTQPNSIIVTHKFDNTTDSDHDLIDSYPNSQRTLFDTSGGNYRMFAGSSYSSSISANTSQTLAFPIFNGSSSSLSVNGTLVTGINVNSNGLDTFNIGNTSTNYLLGSIQELIIYNSDQSSNRTGIETNINDFYSIY